MAGKHGGGAWKVAYADFVTAMMALFLMLWIAAQDTKIKEAIQRSFTNPFMSVTKQQSGILPSKQNAPTAKDGRGRYDAPTPIQLEVFRKLNQELQAMLEKNPEYEDNTIQLEFTDDGLNISVLDRAHKPVFEPDSAQFTEYGTWVFTTLSWVISHYRTFLLELEGHTEQGHPLLRESYDNWELTADRANAARRILVKNGVGADQVRKVSGYGDTRPMPNANPTDELNRRVTVLLRARADSFAKG